MAPTKVILLALLLALVNLAKSETKPKIDEKTSFQPRPPILAGNGAQTFGTPTGGVVGGDSYYPGNNNNNGYPPYNNNGNNGNNGFYPDDTIGNGNLVAFSVNRAARYTQSAPSTVQFERTITDIGYGWDPNTSSFQCYYPGLYVFSWSGVSPSNYQFRLALTLNGREVAFAWGERSGYQGGSNTVVLSLRQGDRVQLTISEGRIYEPSTTSRGYTTLTGYKISGL